MTLREAKAKLVARYRLWKYMREVNMINVLERKLQDGAKWHDTLATQLRDERHAHSLCKRRVEELEAHAMTRVNWTAMSQIANGLRDVQMKLCAGHRKSLVRCERDHVAVVEFLRNAKLTYAQASRGEQAGVFPETVT